MPCTAMGARIERPETESLAVSFLSRSGMRKSASLSFSFHARYESSLDESPCSTSFVWLFSSSEISTLSGGTRPTASVVGTRHVPHRAKAKMH